MKKPDSAGVRWRWQEALTQASIIRDSRDDVLRIGLGLYHDAEDMASAALRK